MNFSLIQLANVTSAKFVGQDCAKEWIVNHILIDSRSFYTASHVIFCALKTDSSDGHRYILDMYKKGIRKFLVERLPESADTMANATFLVVNSVERALRNMAMAWRKKLLGNTQFIGITGSVGKTVVKELLYQALLNTCDVERSPRSWNSQIGVPLSICEMDEGLKYAIIEVGIDREDDMQTLAELVCPEIGIFMPITSEHDDGFSSREVKIQEKAKLFASCRVIVYDASDPLVRGILKSVCPTARLIEIDGLQGDELNLAITKAVVSELGYDQEATQSLCIPNNRIDVYDGVNDCVILYDKFTNDYRSLVAALDFMRRRATATRKNTLIMTDMLHREMNAEVLISYYIGIIKLFDSFGIDRVVGIGAEFEQIVTKLSTSISIEYSQSTNDFLTNYDINNFSSETIMIFGRPSAELEAIKHRLVSPRHDTILEVNLNSLIHNFNYYRSLLNPTTGLVAMVKASAYGVGAVEVAKTLQAQGASYLAVAVIDEGVELRRGGITMPIMVLNPITGNYKALFDYNLEPSVFSMRELDTLLTEAARCKVETFNAHIKLDTGMHRVGFATEEVDALVGRLAQAEGIHVASIFSHLATADCLNMDDYTEMQLNTFERLSSQIIAGVGYPVKRHILNTAGMMRYAEYQYDMVRLGIGLYGVSPVPVEQTPLSVVASLRSTIISLKHWNAGTTIGYSCRGVLKRNSVIATIPIGYADGIDRHLGNGAASFVIRGVKCPTVGNICMDLCMVDVSDVQGVAIGDSVEIFGSEMPVETLAKTLDTIPYELLTSVSPRVKRIYYRD